MKKIVTMIVINLKICFYFFLPFRRIQEQESNSHQIGDLLVRNICFLCIASRTLPQRHVKLNKLL